MDRETQANIDRAHAEAWRAANAPRLTLSAAEVEVAWAAMCAMTQDVHAPEDNLTEAQWALADRLYERLTRFQEPETEGGE